MIWFNIKALEEQIRNNTLEPKYYYFYFLIPSLLSFFAIGEDYGDRKEIFYLVSLMLAIIFFTYTYLCFQLYQKSGKARDFLNHYLSISFVRIIRLIAFSLIGIVPLAIFFMILKIEMDDPIFEAVFVILFFAFAGQSIYTSFKRLVNN